MQKVKEVSQDKPKFLFWSSIIKGALVALSVSLISILVFAFIMRFVSVADSAIKPINQVIKILSVMIGVFVGLKKSREMGLISGLLVGILYTIIAFISFSILDGSFSFSATLINDLLFGAITGAICGIIFVNFRRK